MANEEQITLNIELYDNTLTEKVGDYTARPQTTGSLRNREIAARIVKERTEYRQETIENILDLADKKKVEAIAEGKSVVDGVGQYLISVRGNFEGEKVPFDPAKHALIVSYTSGQLLRDQLKKTNVINKGLAQTGPVINTITDSTSGSINSFLTSSGPAVINGSDIKLLGDDPAVGVYLTSNAVGAVPVKVPTVIHNLPSQLTVMLPAIETGKRYTLSITTQYSSSNKSLKEPRTYTLAVLLGDNESEKPDEI